jgi:hypothetical protein
MIAADLTPTQQLVRKLYRALGKPPRVSTDRWEDKMRLLIADYKPEDLLAIIEWFPTNPFWGKRVTDIDTFNEHIVKLWQECRADRLTTPAKKGKLPGSCPHGNKYYPGTCRACHEEAGLPFPCPTLVSANGVCRCPRIAV